MDASRRTYWGRVFVAIAMPFLACAIQWQFWDEFTPFVWFLFYPAVFISSWVGRKAGGLLATAISALLVVYIFIPPHFSWSINEPTRLYSVPFFCAMGVLFTITHHRLHAAIERSKLALQRIEVANEELRLARETAEQLYQKTLQSEQLKTNFFANVSHELRTPLALILGPLEHLLQRGGLAPGAESDLKLANRNARLLYHHVCDLLDVSKIKAGRMMIQYNKVDFSALVRNIASHFDLLAADKSIRFVVSANDTVPAQADTEKCQRILMNLLSNAFKFTPAGGEVRVVLIDEGETLQLTVEDSGPGIAPDDRETIFERYGQAPGGVQHGTGLGLTIVQEFVLQHRGTVSVSESTLGGASIRVTLPLRAPDDVAVNASVISDTPVGPAGFPARTMPDTNTPRHGPNTPLLLVVDDNPDMREYIANLLTPRYRVATAENGRQALAQITTLKPDLIVSDVMMADMGGDEMVAALRKMEGFKNTPVLIVSAKVDDVYRTKLLQNGVQEYLYKPFAESEFLARLERIIADREGSRLQVLEYAERAQLALDVTGAGLWDWTVPTRALVVSQRWAEIVGYTLEELQPLTIDTWIGLCHPDDLALSNEKLNNCFSGAVPPYECECRLRHKNGSWVWVLDRGRVIEWTPDGKPLRMIGTHIDISEHKRAETIRLESEQRFHELFDALVVSAILVDPESLRFVMFNDAAAHNLGYSREEFSALTLADLDADRSEILIRRTISEMMAQGAPTGGATRHRAKSGELRDVEAIGKIFLYGGKAMLLTTCNDVTERRRADEALALSQDRVDVAMDMARAAEWEFDVATQMLTFNDRFYALYGTTAEREGGYLMPASEYARIFLPEEDAHLVGDEIARAMAETVPGARWQLEHRIRRRNGEIRHISVNIMTVSDDHGRTIKTRGVNQDITERKRDEEELRRSNERYHNFIRQSHEAIYCTEFDEPIDVSLPVDDQIDQIYQVGYMRECNDAMARMYGLASAEDFTGRRIVDFHGGSESPVNRQAFASFISAGYRSAGIETQEIAPDGSVHWFRSNDVGIVEDGKLIRIWGTALEITEQKRSLEALSRSEKQFRDLFDGLCVGALLYDPDTLKAIAFSAYAASGLGYTRDEFLALSPTDLQARLTEDELRERAAHVIESGVRLESESQFRSKSGELRDVLVTRQRLDVQGRAAVLATWTDITERKRAELALRTSEANLKRAQEIASVGSWAWYIDSDQLEFSDEMCRICGLTREKADRDLARVIEQVVHPADRAIVQEMLVSAKSGRKIYAVSFRVIWPDGNVRNCRAEVGELVLNDAGEQTALIGIVQDITELQRADAERRESAERLRLIVQTGNFGLWDWDLETNRVYFSPEWKRQIGYEPHEITDSFDEWRNRVHPEDLPPALSTVQAYLENPVGVNEVEFRFRHKDGSYRWILAQSTFFRDGTARGRRLMGTHIDITSRKLTEHALRASEERVATVMAALNDGMWDWNVVTGEAYFSPRYYAMLGYKDSAFRACYQEWRALAHPDDIDRIESDLRLSTASGTGFSIDFRMLTHDGEWRWVCTRGKPVEKDSLGNVQRMVGTLSDITERKREESSRRDMEERYRHLVESNFDWVWELDQDGRYTYVSPRVYDMLGYVPEEVLGRTAFDLMDATEAKRVMEVFVEHAKERRPFLRFLNVARHKSGNSVILETTGVPIIGEDGAFLGYRGVDRDVTERHNLEEQLRQSQKMEAIGQLAGGVAHDFNNLLQVISGYTDIALNQTPKDSRTREALAEVATAADRAATLVSQLLAFSRRQIMRPEPLEINEVVSNLLKMLKRVIGEHIRLSFEPGIGQAFIQADRGMLEQILMNLCVNARDAMEADGTLLIATGDAVLDQEFCNASPWATPGRYVTVTVLDTGSGMDEVTLSRIFEPFFTTKGVGKGTGLGLATVYGIVRQHMGIIRVASEPGKGTEFRIYLPVTDIARELTEMMEQPPVAGGDETILLAEDEEGVRKLMTLVLQKAGYSVIAARDGQEALTLFEASKNDIDLLLLDLVMPNMGGRRMAELAHRIRAELPALFASGYNEDAIHTNFVLEEGMVLLQKPCNPNELLRKVREMLDRSRMRVASQ